MIEIDSALSGCIMPSGDFTQSCANINLTPYHSTDLYVPVLCKLTADCDSFSDYRPDIHNEIYLPQNTIFSNLNNVNGILSYGISPLNIQASETDIESFELTLKSLGSIDYAAIAKKEELTLNEMNSLATEVTKKANIFRERMGLPISITALPLITAPLGYETKAYEFKPCSQLEGSYVNSCTVKNSQYTSSDIKLKNTELCEIEVNCLKADGNSRIDTSTVYSNINEAAKSTTVQRLENCDGRVVISNLDNQCNNLNEDNIKYKSSQGRSGKIMR